MRENISSTGGVNSSTIFAMLKSSPRRLFSRQALRVRQHAPIISEKLRNFRLPDVYARVSMLSLRKECDVVYQR